MGEAECDPRTVKSTSFLGWLDLVIVVLAATTFTVAFSTRHWIIYTDMDGDVTAVGLWNDVILSERCKHSINYYLQYHIGIPGIIVIPIHKLIIYLTAKTAYRAMAVLTLVTSWTSLVSCIGYVFVAVLRECSWCLKIVVLSNLSAC